MQVLPRVVFPAGAMAAISAAVTAAIALAGCSRFDAALGQRQAVVSFHSGTSNAERLTIRAACAKTPEVSAQPLPEGTLSPYALNQVTFVVTKASEAQVAELEKCLSRYPAVSGVNLQDSSDTGG
jgi:hypothetical protein